MNTLKTYVLETLVCLALLGIAYLYFVTESGYPNRRLLEVLGALYVLLGACSETAITSAFRPPVLRLLGLNLMIATVVSLIAAEFALESGSAPAGLTRWEEVMYAVPMALVTVGAGTLAMRMSAAVIALRAPKGFVQRVTAGVVGSVLAIGAFFAARALGESVFYDYYLYPIIKDYFIAPVRWQDFAALGILLGISLLFFYLAYRLIKFALHSAHVARMSQSVINSTFGAWIAGILIYGSYFLLTNRDEMFEAKLSRQVLFLLLARVPPLLAGLLIAVSLEREHLPKSESRA